MGRGQRKPGARWTPTDWALAQALTQFEAMICSGCGQPMHESMDPENEGRYVAPPPSRCYACTAVHHKVADYEKADAPEALKFSAELHPRSD